MDTQVGHLSKCFHLWRSRFPVTMAVRESLALLWSLAGSSACRNGRCQYSSDLRLDHRITLLAYLTLKCLALFSLIWIASSIHPSWATPVLIAFGILAVSLIFMHRNEIRIRQ